MHGHRVELTSPRAALESSCRETPSHTFSATMRVGKLAPRRELSGGAASHLTSFSFKSRKLWKRDVEVSSGAFLRL
jgi:hypothetical protein